jgi:hypothetical protein
MNGGHFTQGTRVNGTAIFACMIPGLAAKIPSIALSLYSEEIASLPPVVLIKPERSEWELSSTAAVFSAI